ncbi:MAG: penicillin-binding protein 2, partial [Acidobacteriaceae bacterium]|nr:penicillin-binding protein 2 [Acidobacteriaceae bacterium]
MNTTPPQTMTAPIRRIRFVWVAFFFCFWTGALGAKLVWLQVICHKHWVGEAAKQQQVVSDVAPQRGVILDRNLKGLALTVKVDSIAVDPSKLGNGRKSAARMLSLLVHSDPRDVFTSEERMLERFNVPKKNFAWVARRIDAKTAERVKKLDLDPQEIDFHLIDSIYAVPSELGDNRKSAAEMLSRIVHTDPRDSLTTEKQILNRFNSSEDIAWVTRKVSADAARRVKELNLTGIYLHIAGIDFKKECKRFYPGDDRAAQVLGYVGADDTGLGGLELKFDKEMHGAPGHILKAIDARQHTLDSEEKPPVPGQNLVLTIDANIQYMAERALDAQMKKVKALHGTVVVQDPHTGQILALAISPRFDPNDQRNIQPDMLKNLAVSDVYEPGSTFKLVTYAAAIDSAGVQPTDIVDCQGGAMTMYGSTLHDDKSDHFGKVTVQYALEHSSDVGAAKMALKLGPDKFYEYMKAFGFGERTGIELPSETRGLLRSPRMWDPASILYLAIGQEIGVTPIQLAAMVSTIANGGVYLPPRIVLQQTNLAE